MKLYVPRVSVIITTYNYARFLPRALNSVFTQTFPKELTEIIVIDDGSTDNTQSVLKEFSNRVQIIHQENKGQAAALNRAIEICRGEIVALLDPDDEWFPAKLSRTVPYFEDQQVGMVQHQLKVEEDGKNSSRTLQRELSRGKIGQDALTYRFHCVPTSGLVFRKEILMKALPIPVNLYTGGSDHYLSIIAGLVSKIAAIDEPLGIYRIHGENLFKDNLTIESLEAQLSAVEEIFQNALAFSRANGLKQPPNFERFRFAEFPISRRLDIARQNSTFWNRLTICKEYARNYAGPEYGWGWNFIRHVLHMTAYALIPQSMYQKFRFAVKSNG